MKITVLDGYTLNPGDLDWTPLEDLGDCRIFERTPPSQTVERASGSEILITNKVALGSNELKHLPDLQYIGVSATGVNVVDLDAARQRDIVVTNVPAYSTPSVAQLTFALIMELARRVGMHAELVRRGRWTQAPDFSFWESSQIELTGKVLGLVGFGAIGQAVARIGRALEMRILVHTRTPRPREWPEVEFVALDDLFRLADVVSLHCPLNEETEQLVDARRLKLMKATAFLINTGRGGLVAEPALSRALQQGLLAGAGLDVLSAEPPPADNPLLSAPNCLITPHLAWATRAARRRLMETVVANVAAFLAGDPQNRVA
ncbi:MAG TPA: D-2-hydroxyacid dehydrogenase [Desulfuromonadales bacterium]|nr:D-2-hydroxyacid dehydrogenase [Desulfuromonadales bacterium]